MASREMEEFRMQMRQNHSHLYSLPIDSEITSEVIKKKADDLIARAKRGSKTLEFSEFESTDRSHGTSRVYSAEKVAVEQVVGQIKPGLEMKTRRATFLDTEQTGVIPVVSHLVHLTSDLDTLLREFELKVLGYQASGNPDENAEVCEWTVTSTQRIGSGGYTLDGFRFNHPEFRPSIMRMLGLK